MPMNSMPIPHTWTFTIQDNVPLPEAGRGSGAVPGQKFLPTIKIAALQVGQSGFVPGDVVDYRHLQNRISATRIRHPALQFAMRKVTEGGVAGHRVWRTA